MKSVSLRDIKLIILDVDGVLTDGRKTYDKDGNILSKRFNDKDFTAIKRFVVAGIPVVWLSGDEWNRKQAERRNIPFILGRRADNTPDKIGALSKLEKIYKCTRKEMLYVGDDYFDVPVMKCVGFAVCPGDAVFEASKVSNITLFSAGGDGCVAELFDKYVAATNIKTNWHDLVKIDSKEK
jgi:3-deoxy-D-manno-octulosonate 8-phosphate phosphatase (KDO 8-P phosphatase)